MKIVSWNVNGLRAIAKKGFQHWFTREKPDILCIQETKAHPDQLDPSLRSPAGYHAFFSAAEKKGYSGVALFSRSQPLEIQTGFGIDRFDREGRILIATYKDFILFNIYFPNGKQSQERLRYKMDFYAAFLEYIERLKNDKMLIMTGDYNTAHHEIDLAHPKQNEKVSGFMPEERAWMDTYVAAGYVDVFRERHPDTIEYTWWDYKTRARERNIGWRIDYFFVSKGYLKAVRDMKHLSEISGSDHCPLLLIV
ncbi:exodeoxyribonuclease III [bacterium]|nr:exodeoxyribonuclease III [bacterium]